MSPSPAIQSMFDSVYAEPRDLQRRRVLADALMEVGDPRGEFITLQFDTSARSRKRAQKLLARHRLVFLQPFTEVLMSGTEVWSHGFVVSAHLRLTGSIGDVPALATLEEAVGHLTAYEPRELASPWLKSLRKLRLVPSHDGHDPRQFAFSRRVGQIESALGWLARAGRGHVLVREWWSGD